MRLPVECGWLKGNYEYKYLINVSYALHSSLFSEEIMFKWPAVLMTQVVGTDLQLTCEGRLIAICIGCFNVLLHSIYPTLIPQSLFHSNFLRNFFSTSFTCRVTDLSISITGKVLLCLPFLLPTPLHCWGQHSGCYYKLIFFFPELHTFAYIVIIDIHKS